MQTRRYASASLAAVGALALIACSGSQTPPPDENIGTSRSGGSVVDDLDVDEAGGGADGTATGGGTGGTGDTEGGEPATDAPVTFRLTNKAAQEDLVFSLDKGWQPVLFAYSGKPPKATAVLMFPTFCTASCDTPAADRCPSCPQPERVKDIKAAEKREIVAPGKSLDMPWDGQMYVYEKTKGKRSQKCECFRKEPVPPGTYTVSACGLRLTKSAKKASEYQCPETTMTLPGDGPQVIELVFPDPPTDK